MEPRDPNNAAAGLGQPSHIIQAGGRTHTRQKELDIGRSQARFHKALLLLQTLFPAHSLGRDVPPATSPTAAPLRHPPTSPQAHSPSRSVGLCPTPW